MENPEHYKPLRNEMKGLKRAHIGHFVIIFMIRDSTVVFISFKHHDFAY
ncbi:MAG: type II toxin-antitoxin system RelE/ParE family toxin [Candidatus Methanoperedens sp.]|nr:type II toxin-antitoxin system RelE/ParE family toxin [Candidatus Methanoperedens sp.]